MALNRRLIFIKGLGNADVREIDPSPETTFTHLGFLDSVSFNQEPELEEVFSDAGHLVEVATKSIKVTGSVNLLQTSKEEIDIPFNASTKLHAIRYWGPASSTTWQMFTMPVCRIHPGIALDLKLGKRILPIGFGALKQAESALSIPPWYLTETGGEMDITGLQLWVNAKNCLNRGTATLLDVSGWERHATIGSSFASVWQLSAAPYFLRFDNSVNYAASFGDVLDDDATGDFAIEAWMKFPTGGAQEEVICKKALVADDNVGWALHKKADDTIAFKLADGDSNATVASAATVTTTWKHVVAAIDRNGNMTIYINGAASGTPVTVAAQTTATNGHNLYLGRDNTNAGKVDLGDVRIYRYAAGALPDWSVKSALHYASERVYYGV